MKIFKRKSISNHKIKRRYRLSFLSENTFNELGSIKLTQSKVLAGAIVIIAAFGTLVSTIIVGTPLKTFLPGYLKSEERTENILNIMRLDSLQQEMKMRSAYLENIKQILGDSVNIERNHNHSTNSTANDSLMGQTLSEKEFTEMYDEQEKFNLSVLTPIAAEGIVFATPVHGTPEGKNGATTMSIKTAKNATVHSIHNGTVINISNTINGIYITVQHSGGFISIYGNLGTSFVQRGAKVSASQAIGNCSANPQKYPFKFELWRDGLSLPPDEYIVF